MTRSIQAIFRCVAVLLSTALLGGVAWGAGIRVVPSSQLVVPGGEFMIDVVAEGIPAEGLGGVQFRLNVAAPGGTVTGVAALSQGGSNDISVLTPLPAELATTGNSGIGDFFWNGRGPNGILILDNEPLTNGSALYTYAHTSGATPQVGSGTVARFAVKVGSSVTADQLNVTLSDVMLLDGGPAYPLDYNTGASVSFKCQAKVPSLTGLSLTQAQSALATANLSLGSIYQLDNTAGNLPLNVVLEQSLPSGSDALCQAPVNLAVNTPPAEVISASSIDKPHNDTGAVLVTWTPSTSGNVAGYRIYKGATLLQEIRNPLAAGAEVGGLPNGMATQLRVAVFDTFGNESPGVIVSATPTDDVPPVVTIASPQPGITGNNRPLLTFATTKGSVVTRLDGGVITAVSGANLDQLVDGSHTLVVEATAAAGITGSASVTFTVDTLPPSITVNPVATPTRDVSQMLSGSVEVGATVTVAANTSASVGTISYVTPDTWTCPVNGLVAGNNTLTVTATDQAGNSRSVPVTITYHPPMSAVLTPANITNDDKGSIGLTISDLGMPGSDVLVEQFVDANRNDVIDQGDYVVRSFKVTDGTASINPNIQGDEDGAANSKVVTGFNYNLLSDPYHAPGKYLVRATQGADLATAALVVGAVSQVQTISGTVMGGSNPVPGAMVLLQDKWQRPVAWVIADDGGAYVINVKQPGEYRLLPVAYGYSAAATPITVGASQNIVNQGLALVPGIFYLSGHVKDSANGSGIGGIWVRASGTNLTGTAITGVDGSYSLSLPAGQYTIAAAVDPAVPNPSSKGYLAFNKQALVVDVAADGILADINLPQAGILVSGRALNGEGFVQSGIPVQGKIPGSIDVREPVGFGITNADGSYALAMTSGNNWNVSLQDSSAQTLGYIGNTIANFSTSNSPLTGNDLTIYPITAWIQGTVTDSSNNVVVGDGIRLRNADSSIVTSVSTAFDGTYRMGTFAGNWLVDDVTRGNQSLEQTVLLADMQSATLDFVVDVLPVQTITDLKARPKSGKAGLTWTCLPGNVTYNIYRSTTAGGPYTKIRSDLTLTYCYYGDFNLPNDITYYWRVTSVDATGLESLYSNEASATPHSLY